MRLLTLNPKPWWSGHLDFSLRRSAFQAVVQCGPSEVVPAVCASAGRVATIKTNTLNPDLPMLRPRGVQPNKNPEDCLEVVSVGAGAWAAVFACLLKRTLPCLKGYCRAFAAGFRVQGLGFRGS